MGIALGLFLLVILTFFPLLDNGFIFLDDPEFVTQNPHVQSGLTRENIEWAMTSFATGNWHPLTWLSHMLDCQWYGLDPRGHHFTSLLLHAFNTALIFLVMAGMTGAVGRSFFVAAMFGLHPMHVESVAWVSERKDVLSTLFWWLVILAYGGYVNRKRQGQPGAREKKTGPVAFLDSSAICYGLALVCFGLGLMSKPMLVTLPFTLLLLDYWPLNRFKTDAPVRLIWEKAPFFFLSAVICLAAIPAQKSAGGIRTMAAFSLLERIENTPVSYCRYLGKLFWPVNLPFFYPHPGHWPLTTVLAATLLLLCLSGFAWQTRHHHPYLLTGWCWFVGTLIPVIGLVQVGYQSIANRYTYVPYVGLFIGLAWGVPTLLKNWRFRFPALFLLTAAAILVCLPITRLQIGYWKNSHILFQYASVVIDNNWEAHARLGLVFNDEGRLDEAIDQYRQALKLKPDDADTHYDLANALCRKGLWNEAIAEYREDLKLSPGDYTGYNNLGAALFQAGRLSEAIAQFQEALRLKPDYADASRNLATALRTQNAQPAAHEGSSAAPGR